ncbi:hypothetical protein Dimus_022480 [Dionaea muscipula]
MVVNLMDNSQDLCAIELDGNERRDTCGASASCNPGYRLSGSRKPIHQIMGGGKAADVILWKRRGASFGVIVLSTVTWLLFERSRLPFLSVCSDILLVLIVLLFLRANYTVLRNKQLPELPELVLSEEMVNYVASSFRAKVNSILLMAHDITIGKDFRIFFKVVVCLWLLSVVGGLFSFFMLAYVGMNNQPYLLIMSSNWNFVLLICHFATFPCLHQSCSSVYKAFWCTCTTNPNVLLLRFCSRFSLFPSLKGKYLGKMNC